MCVIIERDPGIEIEFTKLKSACEVNPDGYGMIVVDRDRLEIVKELPVGGKNNVDLIAKRLEDAKDTKVILHLRYTTVGATNTENCHPYPVFTRADDGFDIQLMHNGTMSDFERKGSPMSDSFHFAREMAYPLLKRAAASGVPFDKLLDDEFSRAIMQKFIGHSSIVTLVDEMGTVHTFNKSRGSQFDGWWASNTYSFNRYHRTPSDHSISSSSYWRPGTTYDPKTKTYKQTTTTTKDTSKTEAGTETNENFSNVCHLDTTKKKKNPTTLPSASGVDELPFETDGSKEKTETSTPLKFTDQGASSRMTLVEVFGMDDIEDVFLMSYDEIREIVEADPEIAILMIMDLAKAFYDERYGLVDEDE